jgi:hypothetical protein
MDKKCIISPILLLPLILLVVPLGRVEAALTQCANGVAVQQPVRHDISPPLRTITPRAPGAFLQDQELPLSSSPSTQALAADACASIVQSTPGSPLTANIEMQFDGQLRPSAAHDARLSAQQPGRVSLQTPGISDCGVHR